MVSEAHPGEQSLTAVAPRLAGKEAGGVGEEVREHVGGKVFSPDIEQG